jgi:hypothetical protein
MENTPGEEAVNSYAFGGPHSEWLAPAISATVTPATSNRYRSIRPGGKYRTLAGHFTKPGQEIVGDCPDFPMPGEEGTDRRLVGTVPFSETVFGLASIRSEATPLVGSLAKHRKRGYVNRGLPP